LTDPLPKQQQLALMRRRLTLQRQGLQVMEGQLPLTDPLPNQQEQLALIRRRRTLQRQGLQLS
jgi:hypothetical protein